MHAGLDAISLSVAGIALTHSTKATQPRLRSDLSMLCLVGAALYCQFNICNTSNDMIVLPQPVPTWTLHYHYGADLWRP